MSATAMSTAIAHGSPSRKRTTAGAWSLITILAGAFAFFFGERLIVSGDAVRTAVNLLESQPQLRFGVAADLVAALFYIAAMLFVYDLFKPVSRNISSIAAAFSLAGCAIGALSLAFRLLPLIVLAGAQSMRGFTAGQLLALTGTSLTLQGQGSLISLAWFGLHCLLVGFLILSSSFLARLLGVLLVCGGVACLIRGLARLLSMAIRRHREE